MAKNYTSFVLIKTEREKEHSVYKTLKNKTGILEVHGVYDSVYDLVTKINFEKNEDITNILKQINDIPGILETKSLSITPRIFKKGLEKNLKE